MRKTIIYRDIKRRTFEKLAELCEIDPEYCGYVSVSYDGDHKTGNLIIVIATKDECFYGNAIVEFAKVVAEDN